MAGGVIKWYRRDCFVPTTGLAKTLRGHVPIISTNGGGIIKKILNNGELK